MNISLKILSTGSILILFSFIPIIKDLTSYLMFLMEILLEIVIQVKYVAIVLVSVFEYMYNVINSTSRGNVYIN